MGHHSLIFISITDPPKPKELDIDDLDTLKEVNQLLKEGDIKNAKILVCDYLDINSNNVIKYLEWKYLLYDTMRELNDRTECKLMTLTNPNDSSQSVKAYIWGEKWLRWYCVFEGDFANRVNSNLSDLESLNLTSSFDYNYQYLFSKELDWTNKQVEIGSLNPLHLTK